MPKTLLRDRCALVTGSGRGIGAALAHELARQGARVVVSDVDPDAAERIASALPGEGHCGVRLDVTDRDSITSARAKIHGRCGRLEVLVNNAGVVHGGPFAAVDFDRHSLTLRVNTEGMMAVTHAFLDDLVASERGILLQVASASAFLGLPWGASYAASKWAVVGFSESLRLEFEQLGHHHVTVTTLCPSYISTGLFEGVKPPRLTRMLTPEAVAARAVKAAAMGKRRVLTPWLVKVAPLLVGAPAPVSDAISRVLGVSTSMHTWRGRSGPN